jgi:hypothetical protein
MLGAKNRLLQSPDFWKWQCDSRGLVCLGALEMAENWSSKMLELLD